MTGGWDDDDQEGGGAYSVPKTQEAKPIPVKDASMDDPILEQCMENTERLTLFKLEDEIIRFLKNPRFVEKFCVGPVAT